MFMKNLESTLDDSFNISRTENGAIGYRTSSSALLDMNFAVSSLRNRTNEQIVDMFLKAFYENKIYALKWLFYCRDVRGGLGERRTFKTIITYLAQNNYDILSQLVKLIPEYGRYDDMWILLETPAKNTVITYIANQLADDLENLDNQKPITLLAKWLPSANASSKITKHYAKIIRDSLEMSERSYRIMLSKLRRYLDVVEVKMSAKQWDTIKYECVPSKANLIYNDAFLRNDENRRRKYLDLLSSGKTKINSSVLFPHEIYNKYKSSYAVEIAYEEMWKALPNTVQGDETTLVVCDGSGSMDCARIGQSDTKPIDVSNALAIYFAERCSGEFKNKFITFSSRPQLVDLSKQKTLLDKIRYARTFNECSNTNIEATFKLILQTAVNNNMKQSDIPTNILIISDMEFNAPYMNAGQRLFDSIKREFESAGYKIPRLIFWNLASRTDTIPVKENDMGVALVSGFSVNVVNMVMSNSLDPYECLIEILNSNRYVAVENALNS